MLINEYNAALIEEIHEKAALSARLDRKHVFTAGKI